MARIYFDVDAKGIQRMTNWRFGPVGTSRDGHDIQRQRNGDKVATEFGTITDQQSNQISQLFQDGVYLVIAEDGSLSLA